ncbi:hypothetical protein ACQR1I_34130 [Bradyrhizobium sp. HKCCYLS2038]|uniref:hypothetical protein n=1 Tax=unclassified Bradyrhizobium TaxID=2631580 RepID=UPI003EB75131
MTIASGAPAARSSAQSVFAICASALLSSVFLQKIALPGTGGLYPLNLLIFSAVTAAGFVAGRLEINTSAFAWYALFVIFGALSTALSPSSHVSALSLGFFVVAQAPLIFRCVETGIPYDRILGLLSIVGCLSAAMGIVQFLGQFVVGADIAFFVDKHLPDSVTVSGYNSLIPLYWSSPVFKSNGIFFLEPSFFCQFLAIALVAELRLGSRVPRMGLLAAGLLCSYSGTGLTMLALFLPFYFVRHGHMRLFLVAAVLGFVVIAFGDLLSLDAFTRRLGEFSDVQSSGWARFLSMFRVLQGVVFATDATFLFGRGPGTVQEEFRLLSFYAFDPTWGKIIYEYGLLGTLLYARFFHLTIIRGPHGVRFALGYTYLFLGGYLLNPSILMQLAAVVVWFGDETGEERPVARAAGSIVPGLRNEMVAGR